MNVALLHLQGRKPAQTCKERLTERIFGCCRVNQKPGVKHGEELKLWIETPKLRSECCLAPKKFLEYAVARHRSALKDYLGLRNVDGKHRKKTVLTDD
ncbi:hypothetical protein CREGCYN_15970 [Synechococcus sp. M16CYN]